MCDKVAILFIFYLILFLIDINLEKCVINLKEFFMLKYCLDRYKTQEMK